jgi:hypothetical protein
VAKGSGLNPQLDWDSAKIPDLNQDPVSIWVHKTDI